MADLLTGGPDPKPAMLPTGPIEQVLATQANDAMKAGADPRATSIRLRQMVQHVRTNPDFGKQASDAISQGADPSAVSARIWDAAKGTRSDGRQAEGSASAAAIDEMTLGITRKIGAATGGLVDATAAKLRGGNFSDTFGDSYRQNMMAQEGAAQQYAQAHPVADLGARLAGGGVGMMAAGVGGEAAEVPRLVRWAKTIGTGATFGGLSSLGHSNAGIDGRGASGYVDDLTSGVERGAVGGALSIPATAAASKVLSMTPAPRLLAAGAGKLAALAPAGSTAQRVLSSASGAVGASGPANQIIAKRAAMDAAGGFNPADLPVSTTLPAMALDRAGPNVEGLAEGIANKQGPGRATINTALTKRAEQMRPAVTSAFDDATNTTAADGERLLQHLADEQDQRASAAVVAGAVGHEPNASVPFHTPHSAFLDEVGPQRQNAMDVLRQMDETGRAEMNRAYGAAKTATSGMPMQSETLDQVQETPVGKLAFSWAKTQMKNRGLKLPTVSNEPAAEGAPAELYTKLLAMNGGQPEATAAAMRTLGYEPNEIAGASDAAGGKEVPDPQMLHYAKQYLAKLARMGVHDGAQGTLATQAQGALGSWGKIRDELPEIWQQADNVAAQHFGRMEALNAGRNLMRTQASPAGTARQALAKSLNGVRDRMAQAPVDQQVAFGVGARSSIENYLKTANPTKVVADLADPASDLSQRVVLATGDQGAPSRLAARLQPQPQQIPAAPPVPDAPPTSQAASRGVDVFRTPTTPTSAAPGKSLAVLKQDASRMTPPERTRLQRGAAQAARGAFDSQGGSLKSPGRVFDFKSPETSEQLGYAFPSTDARDAFKNEIAGWDRAQQQTERITGNSRTALRTNQQQDGDLVAINRLIGSPRRLLRSVIGKLDNEYQAGVNQRTDAEIAKILTSPDRQAIGNAADAGTFRAQLIDALRSAMAGAAGERARRR